MDDQPYDSGVDSLGRITADILASPLPDAAALKPSEPPSNNPPTPAPDAAQPFGHAGVGHLETAYELPWKRAFFYILALLSVIGFFLYNAAVWVPAHPGVDQNGYLMGGRMMADHGSTRFDPKNPDTGKIDPFVFVGHMWVGAELNTPRERFYPKYPIGLPAIYAMCLKIGGPRAGAVLAYWVSPVCMTLAMWATFLMIRRVTGSFWAWLGMVVMATSPVTLGLATNPNSHASTICCVTWGMYLLIIWWQRGGMWTVLAAGFLLGYAATIRYTEGLLLLPLMVVILFCWQWHKRFFIEAAAGLIGWAIPVLTLVIFNLVAMGTLTGYDPTNESITTHGFSLQFFSVNWYTLLHQLHDTGLAFVFPMSLVGLIWMFYGNWRLALLMTAWALPSTLVYAFYYWAPDGTNIGYLRFFLTILPAFTLAAFWALARISLFAEPHGLADLHDDTALQAPRRSVPSARFGFVVAGMLAAGAAAVNLWSATYVAEQDQYGRLILNYNAQRFLDAVGDVKPANAVVFSSDTNFIHHMQFLTDFRYYSSSIFSDSALRSMLTEVDPTRFDAPQGLDPNRRKALAEHLKNCNTQLRLSEAMDDIILSALQHGRRVFMIDRYGSPYTLRRFVEAHGYEFKEVARWSFPLPPPPPREGMQTWMVNKKRFVIDTSKRSWRETVVKVIELVPRKST